MKSLFLVFIVTTAFLVAPLANNSSQLTEKLIGQCTLTKVSVLKSKNIKKGSTVHNEPISLTVAQRIYSPASYYDYLRLEVRGINTVFELDFNIAHKSYDNPKTAPMESLTKVRANDSKKLDMFFQSESFEKVVFTYDYKRKSGQFDVRRKVNDWGFKTSVNDHIVYEIKSCDFEGPIELNPAYL